MIFCWKLHRIFAVGLVLMSGTVPKVIAELGPDDPVMVGLTITMASSLDPTDGSTPWALISHGIAEKLFTVDKDNNIVGQIANKVEKISDFVWEVTLKGGHKFSDGTDVTAQHVADSLANQNAKNSYAQASLETMTVTAPSDLTVRIESTRQTHVMDSVLAEFAFPIYLAKDDGSFVFTGPFVVESFEEGLIQLKPNEFYDDKAAERPMVTLKKFGDGNALADGLKNHDLDIAMHLPIDTLEDLRDANFEVKSFEVGYHYMVWHNTDAPGPLSDIRVRQAVDHAIDRKRLSQALQGGHATRSLFPDNSPFFHEMEGLHNNGNEDTAVTLLEEAGWMLNSDGKREKEGQILTLKLVAYPHRPGLVIMQPEIKEQLEDIGITVDDVLTGFDWPETATIISNRTFDLLMWAQHTLPAGDPLFFLNAHLRSDGGSNYANIQSATIDARLDALSVEENHDLRVLLSQAAQEAILEEMPVSNLVTPDWHVGLSECLKDYEPWGSDYYVIRSDLKKPDAGCYDTSGAFDYKNGNAAVLMTMLPFVATLIAMGMA